MVSVSEEQVDFILRDIAAHGIETEELKDDLLDHICCIIENEMNTGDDFYEFYGRILPRFFTDELREIQEETDKLLTFKDYYAMKNTLVKSGLLSTILTVLGILFKIMHWPGAGIMLVLGVAIFGLLFIPLMIVLKFRDEDSTIDKWVLSVGLGLGMIASIGVLFKLMHWPFANVLIISSLTAFVLGFVPTYFVTKVRRAELKFNTTVNSVLMMACGCLLFALFAMGNSEAYRSSITPTYSRLIENTENMRRANAELSAQIKDFKEFDELHAHSRTLFDKIDQIKTNIIASSEGISQQRAKTVKVSELKNPQDIHGAQHAFVVSDGELGLDALSKEVEMYNALITERYPSGEEKLLALDSSQFAYSAASVILAELIQIQLQIATNENTYLNQLTRE